MLRSTQTMIDGTLQAAFLSMAIALALIAPEVKAPTTGVSA